MANIGSETYNQHFFLNKLSNSEVHFDVDFVVILLPSFLLGREEETNGRAAVGWVTGVAAGC